MLGCDKTFILWSWSSSKTTLSSPYPIMPIATPPSLFGPIRGAPPVAKKPEQNVIHLSPAPQQQYQPQQIQQTYYNDAVGASDF